VTHRAAKFQQLFAPSRLPSPLQMHRRRWWRRPAAVCSLLGRRQTPAGGGWAARRLGELGRRCVCAAHGISAAAFLFLGGPASLLQCAGQPSRRGQAPVCRLQWGDCAQPVGSPRAAGRLCCNTPERRACNLSSSWALMRFSIGSPRVLRVLLPHSVPGLCSHARAPSLGKLQPPPQQCAFTNVGRCAAALAKCRLHFGEECAERVCPQASKSVCLWALKCERLQPVASRPPAVGVRLGSAQLSRRMFLLGPASSLPVSSKSIQNLRW